jgi:hypothetical protein
MIGGATGVPVPNSTGPGDAAEHVHRPRRDVARLLGVREHVPRQVDGGDCGVGRTEVGREHEAGRRAEAEDARRAAAGRGAELGLLDQAAREQLRDALRDDRPAEAGAGDQLGAGLRPAAADEVEHLHERVELRRDRDRRVGLRGGGTPGRHGTRILMSLRVVKLPFL